MTRRGHRRRRNRPRSRSLSSPAVDSVLAPYGGQKLGTDSDLPDGLTLIIVSCGTKRRRFGVRARNQDLESALIVALETDTGLAGWHIEV
ncbi:MAG: hypothetical protein U0136_00850 [Bdellovibrionota bacterium]